MVPAVRDFNFAEFAILAANLSAPYFRETGLLPPQRFEVTHPMGFLTSPTRTAWIPILLAEQGGPHEIDPRIR